MKTQLYLLLVLISFAFPFQTLFAEKETKIQKKLRDIVIDHIEVEEATIQAVVNLLRIRAKDLDPEKQGINIVLFLEDPKKKAQAQKEKAKDNEDDDLIDEATGKDQKTITLIFDDISLGEAIKNICIAADLKYKIERYAVVIASKDFPMDKMETKIYPVDPEGFQYIKKRMGK